MASAANKPGPVHYALIGTIILSLFLGIMYYVTNKSLTEKLAEMKAAQDNAKQSLATAQAALDQVEKLKEAAGHKFEDVGAADRSKPNTVLNAIDNELKAAAPETADRSYSAAVTTLTSQVRNVTAERDDLRTKLDSEHQAYIALEDKYKALLNEQSTARAKSEQDLQTANKSKEEELAKKNADIEELQAAYRESQVEHDTYKEAAEKKEKEMAGKIKSLNSTNIVLNEQLSEFKRDSFEVPDGFIRWVDNVNHRVYINLGEADRLPLRTTFSVYNESNSGVARGKADVKGSIEVTKIMGPHSAEARILDDDLFNPVSPRDQIYTPLWSPGRPEEFAVVGTWDLDGDGKGDRDLLHEIVSTVGAKISTEIDDNGERIGGPITERTKFLVRGSIPDLSEVGDEEDRKKIQRVNEQLTKLISEAREHGVRIVSMSDFLSYVGYKPQRRVYRPGEDTPYNLNAGSRSASTDRGREMMGLNRESSGATSGAVSGDKKLKPKVSSGQTSKLFRGAR